MYFVNLMSEAMFNSTCTGKSGKWVKIFWVLAGCQGVLSLLCVLFVMHVPELEAVISAKVYRPGVNICPFVGETDSQEHSISMLKV